MADTLQGAAATRQSIISTALRLFAEYGYNAVSTRKIAERSGANIGSIAYHFGGKPGLLIACAHHAVEAIEETLGSAVLEPVSDDVTAEDARTELVGIARLLVMPITGRTDAEDISAFVMRYITQRSEAFDLLYAQITEPLHRHMRQLLGRAAGRDPDAEETKVLTFTIMGQSMYFRICPDAVKNAMGWKGFGGGECAKVGTALSLSINGLIDAYSAESAA
ncbi:CerR family C-terminal domain-containing protein [Martelella radicis]|uniref:AcrR family transcriptional regulator n=1 Tax=Martelella radicis TaxID=1397476 RepID=A0A7W6PAB7_9HYPH|nr:CerR family C-terminal domain-containing protein [Martelella radicis]MBB4121449.1 AcrR family transcriptional regulator [Martelella radicis]